MSESDKCPKCGHERRFHFAVNDGEETDAWCEAQECCGCYEIFGGIPGRPEEFVKRTEDEDVGGPIASKYLGVSTANGVRMSCRLCDAELYSAPLQPLLDLEQMEALLEHFVFQHQIDREELAKDCQAAFEEGMRRERQGHVK